jgi:hypothetical protein
MENAMNDKIKILYLAANPHDTSPLRLGAEVRELSSRIRQGLNCDEFEIIQSFAARPQDLLRGLQEIQPHILHFSGHGTYDKEIVLETEDGESQPINPKVLAELVNQFKTNLKLAVMSCCFGRRQAKALSQVLDFTIGLEKPMSDAGAVDFSANFYQVLASGGSVKQAFESARLVTLMQGHQVFEKCDLLAREGANVEEPFINLLPQSLAVTEESVAKPPSGDGGIVQQVSAGSKVGEMSVMTGDHVHKTTKVSFG